MTKQIKKKIFGGLKKEVKYVNINLENLSNNYEAEKINKILIEISKNPYNEDFDRLYNNIFLGAEDGNINWINTKYNKTNLNDLNEYFKLKLNPLIDYFNIENNLSDHSCVKLPKENSLLERDIISFNILNTDDINVINILTREHIFSDNYKNNKQNWSKNKSDIMDKDINNIINEILQENLNKIDRLEKIRNLCIKDYDIINMPFICFQEVSVNMYNNLKILFDETHNSYYSIKTTENNNSLNKIRIPENSRGPEKIFTKNEGRMTLVPKSIEVIKDEIIDLVPNQLQQYNSVKKALYLIINNILLCNLHYHYKLPIAEIETFINNLISSNKDADKFIIIGDINNSAEELEKILEKPDFLSDYGYVLFRPIKDTFIDSLNGSKRLDNAILIEKIR